MSSSWMAHAVVRRWVFLGYWALMFVGTHIPRIGDFGSGGFLGIRHFDKVVHGCMYAGWMVLAWWLLCTRKVPPTRAAAAGLFVAVAAYGAFDELTQSLVGRETSVGDYIADLIGAGTALVLLWRWRRPGQRPAA